MEDAESISPSRVTVAGIGASAGGIDALRHFFAAVPPDLGLVYVVIVHLAPDHESQLCSILARSGDPRSPVQGGLGIGLALAKSLVEMHGGSIDAASSGVDRGSVFTVRLPVTAQAHASESASQEAAETDLGGHRVLVVDDNADAANTLAVLIRALGENEVHVALSGEEALPLAERVKPDTIFLDLKMPEMDGYEVAERLRSEPWGGDAFLVALTGWGLEEHKRRTKDVGFDQHLTKPADRAALEDILRRPAAGARVQ